MDQALEHGRQDKKAANTREEQAEHWIKAIDEMIRRTVRNGGYGTLRVEIFGGNIKRAIVERSVARPEHLEQFEPEQLASGK